MGMLESPARQRAAQLACLGLLFGILPAAMAAKAAAPEVHKPLHALKPVEGYYDEGFSLEPGGGRLVVIRTDGATFSKLEIIDLKTGQLAGSADLGQSDQRVDAAELLANGAGTLLTIRDLTTDRLSAALLDATGRVTAKTPSATAFGRSESLVVAMDKKGVARFGTGSEVTYTISAFRLPGLAPVGKPHVFKVGPEGDIKGTDIKFISFHDGYAKILGQRAGSYDKQKDFRRPSRMVVLDALTGKVASENEIEDVYAWALASKLRGEKVNRTTFVQLNQEQNGFDVVDSLGRKQPLSLAVPFRLYDHRTLNDQEGPEKGAYYVAVAIDPVNPDAVARQKADLPMLDLYAVDVAKRSSTHRTRILLPRAVTWKAGYGKLVVLKRFKSFARGGDALDVYDIP
ncbi:MAG TPA: hypothetical protein VFH73_23315 [Polyangia bacterium]|nr:hypothetical protein [Polyangia bacterium]